MGKRGPAPIPTELKKLMGTDKPSRLLPDELQLTAMDGIPLPPEDSWPEEMKTVWTECCISLWDVKLLFKEDLAQLRIYCMAVHRIIYIEAKILKQGEVITVKSVKNTKYKKRNDWLHAYVEWAKIADKLGGKFGFTPSDRTRISAAQKNDKDPMSGML